MLDTSIVVSFFRQDQAIIADLRDRRAEGLAVSAISVGELYEGIFLLTVPSRATDAERVLVNFLGEITVLSVNAATARVFGQERARLRRAGRPMGDADLLIAATALHHDLTLLTRDRDFERVSELSTIYL